MQGDVHVRVLMDRSGQLMSLAGGGAQLRLRRCWTRRRSRYSSGHRRCRGCPSALKGETMDLNIPIRFRITK